jgi:hypothetical protein
MMERLKKRLATLESKLPPPASALVVYKRGESIRDACLRLGVLPGQRVVCVPEKRPAPEAEQ